MKVKGNHRENIENIRKTRQYFWMKEEGDLLEKRLTFFAEIFRVGDHPDLGMWLLYGTIVLLSIIAYQLGFARKLSLIKTVIVYIFLFLGCTVLTFLAVFLPVAEGLFVICLAMFIYRLRKAWDKKEIKM